ncbi:hypothetical protein RJT34_19108 [Clitoria ternatea]|uniref:Uncharacterized protein n=1 Tax=Clitoria ternatea TaxID=43366 RepID=A0AAN9IQE9_CLITE
MAIISFNMSHILQTKHGVEKTREKLLAKLEGNGKDENGNVGLNGWFMLISLDHMLQNLIFISLKERNILLVGYKNVIGLESLFSKRKSERYLAEFKTHQERKKAVEQFSERISV